MTDIAFFILVFCLVGVCVGDLRTRSFHVGWLLPIFSSAAILGDPLLGFVAFLPIAIALTFTWGILSLRRGGVVNFFREFFGLGDLLLLIALCPLFADGRQLLIVLVTSCFLGLILAAFGLEKQGVPFAIPIVLATAISFSFRYLEL